MSNRKLQYQRDWLEANWDRFVNDGIEDSHGRLITVADALAKALKQIEAIRHEPIKRDGEPFRPEYRQPAIEKLGYYNRSDYLPYRI